MPETEVIIRSEAGGDAGAITEVTEAAFRDLEISNQTEHFIVEALRRAGALALSLVAETGGRVVGHVAFSPVTISDGTGEWYGLGPVSVLPEYQGRGVGSALIERGLSELRDLGARGCVLVGFPDYYIRFGFRHFPGLVHEGVPPDAFMALPFNEEVPSGRVTFHRGFQAKE
ncbi:MAG: GNAT family N-acetyltransferase [Candidatus Latescibacteria bacterium]|nr:GNAT family N-acetyltransferase [Candidatus Latescibacterota bacterium]